MISPIRNRLNVPIVSMPARSRHWWRLIVEKQKKNSVNTTGMEETLKKETMF